MTLFKQTSAFVTASVMGFILVLIGVDAEHNRRVSLENYFESSLRPAAESIQQDYEHQGQRLVKTALLLKQQPAVNSLMRVPGIGSETISEYCQEWAQMAGLPYVALLDERGKVLGSFGAPTAEFTQAHWASKRALERPAIWGPLAAGDSILLVAGVPIDAATGSAWLVLGEALPLELWDAWARQRTVKLFLLNNQSKVLYASERGVLRDADFSRIAWDASLQHIRIQDALYAAIGVKSNDKDAELLVAQPVAEGKRNQPWVHRYVLAIALLCLIAWFIGLWLTRRRPSSAPSGPMDNATREMVRSLLAIPVPAEEALNVLEEGLVRTDARMSIRWANRAFAVMVGVEPEELQGQSLVRYCPQCETLVTSWSESHLKFLSSEPKHTELLSGATTVPMLMRTVLKREEHESEPSFYFIFSSLKAHQQTDRLDAENKVLRAEIEALKDRPAVQTIYAEKDKPDYDLETWLRAAVHQVKNPLGVVVQGLDYLENSLESRSASCDEVLAMMRGSVSQADQVLRGLLQFSRLEHLETKTHAVEHLIEQALERVKPVAAERNSTLRVRSEATLPEVEVDAALIVEALSILVEQSLARCPSGSEIEVNAAVEASRVKGQGVGTRKEDVFQMGDRVLVVEVLDRGPEMDAKQLERLSKPFMTQPGAAGAGLALVSSIAHMNRGALQISSSVHAGTRFRLLLPVQKTRLAGHARLLLIDDDRGLCKLLKLNLEKSGDFQVEVAYTGQAGLDLAANGTFDIVLTDYQLPDIDGKQILKTLKDADEQLPVVLFSICHDHTALREDPELKRADGFLAKPIDHVRLHETLARLLRKA